MHSSSRRIDGHPQVYDFVPETYILPAQLKQFTAAFHGHTLGKEATLPATTKLRPKSRSVDDGRDANSKLRCRDSEEMERKVWIHKPGSGTHGLGIYVFAEWDQFRPGMELDKSH